MITPTQRIDMLLLLCYSLCKLQMDWCVIHGHYIIQWRYGSEPIVTTIVSKLNSEKWIELSEEKEAIGKLNLPVNDRDHIQGPRTASVKLVEYGDYECPYTSQAYPIVKEIQRRLAALCLSQFSGKRNTLLWHARLFVWTARCTWWQPLIEICNIGYWYRNSHFIRGGVIAILRAPVQPVQARVRYVVVILAISFMIWEQGHYREVMGYLDW